MISEFSLYLFTTLGGLAAGAYIASAFFPAKEEGKAKLLLPIVALVLLAISGVALLLHLGRPERVLNAFSNPGAGIAQEGLTTAFFGVMVVIDLVLVKVKGASPKAVPVLAAIAGSFLVCAMAAAYVAFVGVPTWHNWTSVPLFVVGAIAAGLPLIAVFDRSLAENGAYAAAIAVVETLAALAYLASGYVNMAAGFSLAPFAFAALLAVVAAVLPHVDSVRKAPWGPAVVFALAFVALVIARYAYYAVV